MSLSAPKYPSSPGDAGNTMSPTQTLMFLKPAGAIHKRQHTEQCLQAWQELCTLPEGPPRDEGKPPTLSSNPKQSCVPRFRPGPADLRSANAPSFVLFIHFPHIYCLVCAINKKISTSG